ncbi:aminoglycoside phosphotransferase family protein [Hymenobacter setariae]|uniref:Aminoglycoside phosphotransferase family protein n=1 Tax=Hymenobacter setariae TaxID=2594794 RepID=A0A558BMB3_9BACT|nr:aminoglycoside phosphotransferase family protein [Hymenobacter setariae]TVT37646.1 aminoglycoside phosphotransferase family protein [Hymenobacter setariae]
MDLVAIARHFPACVEGELRITPITDGLINATYRVELLAGGQQFILQKINTAIFRNPAAVARNHSLVNELLAKTSYPRQLVRQLKTTVGNDLLTVDAQSAWRLLDFVTGAHTIHKANSPATAFEAAKTLGEFLFYLNQHSSAEPEETLPGFVDFAGRMRAYQAALGSASPTRRQQAAAAIHLVNKYLTLPDQWIAWQAADSLPRRIIHGDPKISNVLFDSNNQGLCVIDLDTVMSATLLYDFGDMARSYTNETVEDDAQATSVFDPDMYLAVKQGFSHHLGKLLAPIEAKNLDYAAQTVIFIQAVRFLTDYLNGDVYYATRHATHNLDRAQNQLRLLTELTHFLTI